ncbi:hypothetical protein D3C85_1128240 [compost metagenome]
MIEVVPGRYAVDDAGNVYSLRNTRGNLRHAPLLMQRQLHPEGYLTVTLATDVGKRFCLVHRLVAQAYLPNPEDKPEVNHKDGDKTNNVYTNLEWVTESENTVHAFNTGLRTVNRGQLGRTNGKSVLSQPVARLDMQGNLLEIFPSMAEAHRNGYSQGNISSVIAGNRGSHKGCLWALA